MLTSLRTRLREWYRHGHRRSMVYGKEGATDTSRLRPNRGRVASDHETGKRRCVRSGREQAKTLVNMSLIPKLELPLRDAPQTNKGALVDALDVQVRTIIKSTIGPVGCISNAYLYSDLGIGMVSLRRRLHGDMFERLQRALLKPTARMYWENRKATNEAREISHRNTVDGDSEEESTMRLARAEAEMGLVEDRGDERTGLFQG